MANGLTQTVQLVLPKAVLGLGLGDLAAMRGAMQIGQIGYSAWAGRMSDRHGNRPVLVLSQVIVSLSLLFFLLAAPQPAWCRWLLLGAWVLWSAYAGHNLCLPNLALKLAPVAERPEYIAVHEALGGLLHGAAVVAGGYLFDLLAPSGAGAATASATMSACRTMLVAGLAMRLAAATVATRIREPGAAVARHRVRAYPRTVWERDRHILLTGHRKMSQSRRFSDRQ